MKVGINLAPALKEKSDTLQIPFADLLRGYVLEDFLIRVYESPFHEVLWLANESAVGMESYKQHREQVLQFYYAQSDRTIEASRLIPGQKLTEQLQKVMETAFFTKQTDVTWEISGTMGERFCGWQLEADFCDMRVPLYVRIQPILASAGHPIRQEFVPFMDGSRRFPMYLYAPENRLGENLYAIIRNLELIPDMGAYDTANRILKSEPVSGRHILEELQALSQNEPRVRREKRLEQLEEYLDYGYMRKRWISYEKSRHQEPEEWEDVMARVLCFLRPVWTALCRNEIFFDDWMPELGRFLG